MYTIEETKKALREGIQAYLLKDEMGTYLMKEVHRLPFFLEGAPGIGKTEIVKQIADEMDLNFVSFSLVHHTRNSLLGLPVITEMPSGSRYTEFTMSEIIARVNLANENSSKKEGILLLDEFPCMSETILPAMLSFLQCKNIGSHNLPEGWVIVLCGNPKEYNRSVRQFDAAILDRLRKIEISHSAEVFTAYAKERGLNEIITTYLEMYPSDLYRCNYNGPSDELVTCRGWENLSITMELYQKLGQEITLSLIQQFIRSEEISRNFFLYLTRHNLGMTEQEFITILSGKATRSTIARYSAFNFIDQWKAMEYLLNYAASNISDTATAHQKKSFAKKIDSLFKFAEKIDLSGNLEERLFYTINANGTIVCILSTVTCPSYTDLCLRNYGA